MKVLQITQVMTPHDLTEIVLLEIEDALWPRLHRVFSIQVADSEPLQVWLDLLDDQSLDLVDDPIQITASQGQWLLRDFFHRPKTEWGRIKQN